MAARAARFLIWPSPRRRTDVEAEVVGVSDGDTLAVLRDEQQTRIRLNGADAPNHPDLVSAIHNWQNEPDTSTSAGPVMGCQLLCGLTLAISARLNGSH